MFIIQNISGAYEPYIKGVMKTRRSVQKINAADPSPAKFNRDTEEPPEYDFTSQENDLNQKAIRSYGKLPINKKRRKIILAQDLMTQPVFTISPNLSLNNAWQIITEKRFRHLLISSGENKLIGILSDRDLLKEFIALQNKERAMINVSEIMRTDILSATPDTEIREIARVLFEERVGCMPILDSNYKLTGIITRSDILRALLTNSPLELWI